MMQSFDIVIAGSGAASLYCATHLNPELKILILTKAGIRQCNSYLAQGGITTVLDEEDKADFIEDTMLAGKNENDRPAVELLAEKAMEVLDDLVSFGVPFSRKNNQLCYTKEGAHRKNRIAYAKDQTGKYVMETLIDVIQRKSNVTIWENMPLIDILEDENHQCAGVIVDRGGQTETLYCQRVILATGGIGGLFKNSTNDPTVTGDGLAIASEHGVGLRNIGYIQFHPTTLYDPCGNGKRFLISESVRGEGAYLLNQKKERFVDELLPRDEVCKAILREQQKTPKTPYVFLDISHEDETFIKERFPFIYQTCLEHGYDMTKEAIPVTPAEHYHMGGIAIDLNGRTSMKHLYAIGEAACSGVHGRNRLASNSLLEAVVFAKACAQDINENLRGQTLSHHSVFKQADKQTKSGIVANLIIQENGEVKDELFYR